MVYILRNNQKYGPYDDNALVTYVNSGQLLMVDSLLDDTTGESTTVRRYIKKHNIKVKVQHGGSFANQLNKIGTELLVPKDAFKKKSIVTDTRLILLGLVGLVPSVLMFLPIGGFFVFYLVSLYFAIIWGLFFYKQGSTPVGDLGFQCVFGGIVGASAGLPEEGAGTETGRMGQQIPDGEIAGRFVGAGQIALVVGFGNRHIRKIRQIPADFIVKSQLTGFCLHHHTGSRHRLGHGSGTINVVRCHRDTGFDIRKSRITFIYKTSFGNNCNGRVGNSPSGKSILHHGVNVLCQGCAHTGILGQRGREQITDHKIIPPYEQIGMICQHHSTSGGKMHRIQRQASEVI